MFRFLAVLALASTLLAGGARADEAIKTTVLLKTITTNIGQPIAYPRHGMPQITTMIIEIPPGAATPLHTHPAPLVGYILEGQLEVRAAGGKINRYKAGDAFVEALNHAHAGTNIGPGPLRILVTVIGTQGVPYAVPVKQ
ncbi:MAG TPA: cupin domain-containing protein [Stellaceae bacterium]|nr:cupin domain-containing protein [Stellaceae bacterium]